MSRAGSITRDPTTKTWTLVVDLSAPGAKRRRQARRRGFPTRKAAQAELDRLKEQVRTGSYVTPARLTLGEYLDSWLKSRPAAGLKPTTVHSYGQKIAYVHSDDAAGVPLQSLAAIDLDALYAKLLEHGAPGGRGPLSARSVRFLHTVVKKALKDAVRKGLVVRNVAEVATPPSATAARAPEFHAWTPAELARFLDSTAEHQHATLFRLYALTGLRRGEALGLRWSDVDLDAATVTVRHTIVVVKGTARAGTPKTLRSRRTVDLDPRTVVALRAHRTEQRKQRLLVGAGYRDEGYVFAQVDGSHWHPDAITGAFDRATARTPGPVIRLHDLRHTHASHLIAAGANVKVVSERLGHSSVSFTLDVYAHLMPGQQADAVAAVAALVDAL